MLAMIRPVGRGRRAGMTAGPPAARPAPSVKLYGMQARPLPSRGVARVLPMPVIKVVARTSTPLVRPTSARPELVEPRGRAIVLPLPARKRAAPHVRVVLAPPAPRFRGASGFIAAPSRTMVKRSSPPVVRPAVSRPETIIPRGRASVLPTPTIRNIIPPGPTPTVVRQAVATRDLRQPQGRAVILPLPKRAIVARTSTPFIRPLSIPPPPPNGRARVIPFTIPVTLPFNPALATDIRLAIDDAADLVISWTSLAPPGTAFQVYINGALAWKGFATFCIVPAPLTLAYIVVGAVLPDSYATGFAGSLPLPPGGGEHVTLNWLGGTYLDPDIQGFHVYGSDSPGGSVDTTKVLATIPAYPTGVVDGFGVGGFGQGGFGLAASSYSWTSGPLSSGTWTFEVTSVDAAGNENKLTGSTTTATIAGPPREPAPFSDGLRLHQTYNAATKQVTLSWNLPPT
jgi:hypothetical protein